MDTLNVASSAMELVAAVASILVIIMVAFRKFKKNAIAPLVEVVEEVRGEMRNNGGNSLRDIMERVEVNVYNLEGKVTLVSEAMNLAMVETDAYGRCTFASKEWSNLTGISQDLALGAGWQNAIHPDDRLKVANEWEFAVDQERDFIMTFRLANGIEVVGHALPVTDSRGGVIKYVATIKKVA